MNKMTDLDRKLQEIAATNWDQFIRLVGHEAILSAKVCILRQRNASYGEIGNRLGLTNNQVRYGCIKCEEKTKTM